MMAHRSVTTPKPFLSVAASALLFALTVMCALHVPHVAADAPAEERLAARYSPIAYLKTQKKPCDDSGEPFTPGPVESVVGNPAVVLREAVGIGLSEDPVDAHGPSAADLAAQGSDAYLDLPGDPFSPGCDYEREYRKWMAGKEPVAYARFATESGRTGSALQYWLWYPFNDFNNRHEGGPEYSCLSSRASRSVSSMPSVASFTRSPSRSPQLALRFSISGRVRLVATIPLT